jgi:GalNAc-alpha-(1->4)-GalNAc-alpha-(1->3)-diNAcBac-PP-undecaprenol alpha-1,4-N-acetyl-D-galactosaminyltransferase
LAAKKKVCLIIPSLQAGGMERVMSLLANYFSKTDAIECSLILYGLKRDIFYSIDSRITIYRPPFSFNKSHRLWNSVKTLFFLRKTVRQIGPDTVLSFGEIWNNLVLISLTGLNIPIYVSDR